MNIRTPQSGKAAKLAKAYLQSQGLSVSHQQCLELVARLHGYQDWQAMQADPRFVNKPVLKPVSSHEYVFDPKSGSAWVSVDNISVRVLRAESGVSVDMYPVGREDSASLSGAILTYEQAGQVDNPQVWIQYDKDADLWHWSTLKVSSLKSSGPRPTSLSKGFVDPESVVEDVVETHGEGIPFDWERSDAPVEATCNVFQDNGEYLLNLDIRSAREAARDMRDAGVGGLWTVETEDGELVAFYR